jgi:hypothetical protein
MTTFTVLAVPLAELEKAIRANDVPGIFKAVSRIIAPMGAVYALTPREQPGGVRRTEAGRGDRVIECERCIRLLEAMPAMSGLGGVVWDQGWAIATLQYVSALLRGAPHDAPRTLPAGGTRTAPPPTATPAPVPAPGGGATLDFDPDDAAG